MWVERDKMILDDDELKKMGYVCTECGNVSNRLKTCHNGCTKVCPSCLKDKGLNFVFCKKCGDMTLINYNYGLGRKNVRGRTDKQDPLTPLNIPEPLSA